jgi:hypothetical protein
MVTRIIYLLLFVVPQVLVYLYLRERLPDPTRPRQARLVRTGLAAAFTIFNIPWIVVAGRVLFGSLWGLGRIPYLGPWIAWQILGLIFAAAVSVYLAGKVVVWAAGALRALVARRPGGAAARGQAAPPTAPSPSPSRISRRRFLARATYGYAGTGAVLSGHGI